MKLVMKYALTVMVMASAAAMAAGTAPATAQPGSAGLSAAAEGAAPAAAKQPAASPGAAGEAAPLTPAAMAPETPAPEGARAPVRFEDLKSLYRESPLVVVFQAESIQGNPTVSERLIWEVRGPVIEVLRGNLLPGRISLHVESVVKAFDRRKSEVEGKTFVAAIKPLGDAALRRFQLMGPYAFAADSKEAEALRQLAATDAETGAGGQNLELVVRPVDKIFAVSGSKTIEVRLTNKGTDSATYLQAPLSEKDGRLFLPGPGTITIRDMTGRIVPDKGNIVRGMVPPPPPRPALILPNASFVENIDLSKYYDLPEGRYTLVLALAAPDGRGRIPSNGFSFQVGAVNLPESPPKAEPVRLPDQAAAQSAPERPTAAEQSAPAKPAPALPDPAKYQPGKPSAGLAGLLRPSKSVYKLGEPVEVEFRLINQGPRTLAVDVRLERTLTVQVQEVGDSPPPLFVVRQTPWAPDPGVMPDERALLREGAFWGRTININTLYGKTREELIAQTPESLAAGKEVTYERHGKVAYGFPKPGVYNVTATYVVSRPAPPSDGQAASPPPKEWWVGELQTNTITIQIGDAVSLRP